MIKLAGRHNIIYIIQLVIWSNIRTIDIILLGYFFNFKASSIFTPLMFLGEFTSGAIVYRYQSKYLRNKDNDSLIDRFKMKNLSIESVQEKSNKFKVFILLFLASFLDFAEYIITTFYIKKFTYISSTLDSRCYSFLVICNGVAFKYLLRIKIFKHQILSLIIIFLCFIITLASEYLFQRVDEIFTYAEFTVALALILVEYFYLAMMDIIDKYLLEFESVDPFLIIMVEGLIGLVFGILFCWVENPLPELKYIYNNNSTSSFILFIAFLFLFFICTNFRVAFRIMINKLYSPMVLTLSDYFLNPIYIIYNYINGDFKSKEGQNIFYFVLNLILSILTAFSTFIYNEFIVLFCYGLELNTHDQITKRSKLEEIEMNVKEILNDPQKEDEENESDDKNNIYPIYV